MKSIKDRLSSSLIGGYIKRWTVMVMKRKRVLLSLMLVVVILAATLSMETKVVFGAPVSVSTLNGKYISVDGIPFRVLDANGYAVATSVNALGSKSWTVGLSAIQGLANNKSYIKEARYMTEAEWLTYQATLGIPGSLWMWLQDPYTSLSNISYSRVVRSDGILSNSVTSDQGAVRPALILESTVEIASGTGTSGSPYVIKSDYGTGGTISGPYPTPAAVSTLNGKYISVDGIPFRVLNSSGYAAATSYNALGSKPWSEGLSAIQGLAKNKSYIKEARYMTVAEGSLYKATLGNPGGMTWLMDVSNGGYNFFCADPWGTFNSSYIGNDIRAIRPAIFLESIISIKSGTGTVGDPYILDNSYPTIASGGSVGATPIYDPVSVLNGKYISVDSIPFRVLNSSGYAAATSANALGMQAWPNGFSAILGLAKNKSYIKEARYITYAEWDTYKATLGAAPSVNMWLNDTNSDYFQYSAVYADGAIVTARAYNLNGVRPALILESMISIKSGAGTVGDPYILNSDYGTSGSSGGSVGTSPALTVTDGKPFILNVAGGDSIANNATADGVTVTNTNTTDGYIQLSGTLTGLGLQVVDIGGNKFVFNKVAAQSETPITYNDSVSVLNSKYISVDSITLRVLNSNGYAVATSYNALGSLQWPIGLSAIQGLGNNKSYIKEARYMTVEEWNTHKATLGNPDGYVWLQDPYQTSNFAYNMVTPLGGIQTNNASSTYSVRPALILESNINIQSGTGTLLDPYILKNDYTVIGSNGTPNPTSALTVVGGQAFSITVIGVDSIVDGTSAGGVTVTNTSTTDGLIILSGTLTGTGNQVLTIGGIKFVFNKIAAPSGTTITATFS